MLKKQCRECSKVSYSISSQGIWICPHCAADITNEPLMRPAPCVAGILPLAAPTQVETSMLN